MATFDFRIKKPNTYGYRLLAVPRTNSITADGSAVNSVVGRIVSEDPAKSAGSVTVHWKKARTRLALFSGREEASGTVSSDVDGYFTLSSITSSTTPGTWLMSFEALVEGRLIGDVVFWNEVPDIVRGVENAEGVPEEGVVVDTTEHDYADGEYEVYSYEESATPTISKPHPWLPPTWYAVSPENQYQLDTDFNLSGYVGDREYTSSGVLGRAAAVYSPRFVEPINGDLYDTTGAGNNLSTATSPEIHTFEGKPYLWYPGTSGNYCTVTPTSDRDGETVFQVTSELTDYTPVTNQVLIDDNSGSAGFKVTLLTSGILSIDLEASTYQTTDPNLIDGNKYIFEFEIDFLASQLVVNIYDRKEYLVFRELIAITETQLSGSGTVYIGADRANSNHITGKIYHFYLQDESGILSQFNFSDTYFPDGISSSTGTDEVDNTITLNRSSTGYKLTLVDRPNLSGKADTYFTSSSSALDIGDRSFTLVYVLQYWNAPAATEPLAMKKATVSTVADAGYALYLSGSNSVYFRSSDGTTQNSRSIPTKEGTGIHYLAVVGDRNTDTIKLTDGDAEDSAAWGVDTVSSAQDFVLLNDLEFDNGLQANVLGAALFKEALNDAEIRDAARKLGMDA